MQVLYLIPARGGSKGLPGKNIAELGGKPLIAWTIEAALGAKHKGTVMVSTDSEEIAAISKKYGAFVPFIRPASLATDEASPIDVMFHALDWCRDHQLVADTLVLLQPTSPLRTSADIDGALALYEKKKPSGIISVCEADHHPLRSNVLPADGSMKGFVTEAARGKSRQELPVYYRINGAIYISGIKEFYQKKSIVNDDAFAYVMPSSRSVDIDLAIDLMVAGQLLATKK